VTEFIYILISALYINVPNCLRPVNEFKLRWGFFLKFSWFLHHNLLHSITMAVIGTRGFPTNIFLPFNLLPIFSYTRNFLQLNKSRKALKIEEWYKNIRFWPVLPNIPHFMYMTVLTFGWAYLWKLSFNWKTFNIFWNGRLMVGHGQNF